MLNIFCKKSLCSISELFLPKRLPEKHLHKDAFKAFAFGVLYGSWALCGCEHPRSHSQFWQTSMESGWLPQDPRLLHWSAAVIPERSSFGSHLLGAGAKRRTGWMCTGILCNPWPGGGAGEGLVYLVQLIVLTSTACILTEYLPVFWLKPRGHIIHI